MLRPLGFDSAARARKLPQLLAKKGIPFAFAGESTTRIGLPRLQSTLALLVQGGVDPMQADRQRHDRARSPVRPRGPRRLAAARPRRRPRGVVACAPRPPRAAAPRPASGRGPLRGGRESPLQEEQRPRREPSCEAPVPDEQCRLAPLPRGPGVRAGTRDDPPQRHGLHR